MSSHFVSTTASPAKRRTFCKVCLRPAVVRIHTRDYGSTPPADLVEDRCTAHYWKTSEGGE